MAARQAPYIYVGQHDDRFPQWLAQIPDSPRGLFCRGAVEALSGRSIAIVGSRAATRAGRDIAFGLSRDLAASGITIVSGLARGIDRAAHEGALAAGGCTVAVLGSGLNRVYPRGNVGLADHIVAAGGLLASEFEPDVGPRKHHFPARNRVISGLSRGVVVVEAAAHSGSLITARMGLEQGREVMAVPGAVLGRNSAGCHRLLKQGAALVEGVEDVAEALGWAYAIQPPNEPVLDAEADRALWALLCETPVSFDALAAQTVGVRAGGQDALLERLLEWEVDGFVTLCDGGYIRRPSGSAPR